MIIKKQITHLENKLKTLKQNTSTHKGAKMKLYQIRGLLYKVAKYMGDWSAISKAFTQKSFIPIVKRAMRRIYGKFAGRGMNIFK